MMPLIFVVAMVYPGFATADETADKDICTTTQSNNKLYASPRPDWVGHCFEFAYRSALHQYKCIITKDNECKAPSVVDLVLLGGKNSTTGKPTALDHMKGIREEGIVDEDCFPFEKAFPPPTTVESNSFSDAYNRAILKAFADILTAEEKMPFASAPCTEEMGENNPEIREFALSLANQAKAKILSIIQRKLDSSGCVRHKFPEVEPITILEGDHTRQLTKLRNALETGAPAVLPLFIKQPKGEEKAFHAVMAANYRETCCQGECVREYQIIDSLGYYWTDHQDGWVSEENLLKSLPDKPEGITILVSPDRLSPLPPTGE